MNYFKISLIAILMAVTSCKNQNEEASKVDLNEIVLEDEAAVPRTAESTASEAIKITDRKLIRTGTLVFESDNLLTSAKLIKTLITENNGYISSDQTTIYNHRTDQSMTLRIPNDKFDTVIDQITAHAKKTDSKNINSQDVSEEFVDIQARLNAKKEIEKRYIQILLNAAKVDDILKVESELGTIRTEIESIEGRLRWLENQTTLSTLHVTFYQAKEFTSEIPFLSKLKSAFSDGWNMMVSFLLGLLHFWPFILILCVALFYVRKRFNK